MKIAVLWDETPYSLVYTRMYQTAWRHILEDTNLHNRRSEGLKSGRIMTWQAMPLSWKEWGMHVKQFGISQRKVAFGRSRHKMEAVLRWIVDNSSVGKAMSYRLDLWGSIPSSGLDFSHLYSVQTDFGASTASYKVDTEKDFPGDKVAEAWSWPLISI